jgi:hypothetical protein
LTGTFKRVFKKKLKSRIVMKEWRPDELKETQNR